MTETTLSADPVINVIEQDTHDLPGAVEQSGDAGRIRQLDAAAMDAVSALRRREFETVRARLCAIRPCATMPKWPDSPM